MLQKERFDEIYAILKERNSATVQLLQKRLYVSEATIRRDLEAMEKAGLIERVWGGAMIPSTVEKDIPAFVRSKTNNEKKAKIASIASSLLRDNSSIFIDSSTSCYHLIPYLKNMKQLTVITSSLRMMQLLLEHTSVSVHLLGGQIFENDIMTGHVAVASVREYNSDLMFFSCSGIWSDGSISSIESRVVQVNREMMQHSAQRILLCDSSKFGKRLLWHLADIQDISYIISNAEPEDPTLCAALGNKLITRADQFPEKTELRTSL